MRKGFISYSHADRDICDVLFKHLSVSLHTLVRFWFDPDLKPGENWRDLVGWHIKRSDIALVLVSAESMRPGGFVSDIEIPLLLRGEKRGTTVVIPVRLTNFDPSLVPSTFRRSALPSRALRPGATSEEIGDWCALVAAGLRSLIESLPEVAGHTEAVARRISAARNRLHSLEQSDAFDALDIALAFDAQKIVSGLHSALRAPRADLWAAVDGVADRWHMFANNTLSGNALQPIAKLLEDALFELLSELEQSDYDWPPGLSRAYTSTPKIPTLKTEDKKASGPAANERSELQPKTLNLRTGTIGRQLATLRPAALRLALTASAALFLISGLARLGSVPPSDTQADATAIAVALTSGETADALSAVATPDGGIVVYRGETRLGMVRGHGAPIVRAAFVGDGQSLLTLDAHGEARTTSLTGLPARSSSDLREPLASLRRELWAPYGFSLAREVQGWPLNPAETAWPAALTFGVFAFGLLGAPRFATSTGQLSAYLRAALSRQSRLESESPRSPDIAAALSEFQGASRIFEDLFKAVIRHEPWDVEKNLSDRMRETAQDMIAAGSAYKSAFLESPPFHTIRDPQERWVEHIGNARSIVDGATLLNWKNIPGRVAPTFQQSGAYIDVYQYGEETIAAGLRTIARLRPPGLPSAAIPEMVTLRPGRFLMGAAESEDVASKAEYPQHEVVIDYRFAIGKHPVTFAQWDAALEAGAALPRPNDNGWGRGDRPVINVSWQDAQAYIAWLNDQLGLTGRTDAYRLPSEAEWEYACRAGTQTRFSFGDEDRRLGDHAWFSRNAGSQTQPVGRKKPNGFRLYDMHGNVWEWCADPWHETYDGAPADGSFWSGDSVSRKVARGGSWKDDLDWLRSASRWADPSAYRSFSFGFRPARTVSR